MQNWFPHLQVKSYPNVSEISKILNLYNWFFVVHNDENEFVLKLIKEGKRRFSERVKVIYLYPSRGIMKEPYYSDCLTQPDRSIAENLRRFCIEVLRLPQITRNNGFIPPSDLVHRKWMKRVVIHPTSARVTRNWPEEKYVKLALHLQNEGYQIVFVPGTAEKEKWSKFGLEVAAFPVLHGLASFLYESGYLIGNDSGVGHLASALGIPTLTICRRKIWAKMWAPSFAKRIVVTPSSWIPNIKGFRLRDRYWRKLISVSTIFRSFKKLIRL